MRLFLLTLAAAAIAAGCAAGSPSQPLVVRSESSGSGLLVSPDVAPPVPPGTTLIGLSFTAAGARQAFLATESGYSGKISTNSTCAGIATVSPSSANGPVAVFNITAVAAGNCEVTVLDANNRSAGVMVTVTTVVGGIN